MHRNRLAGGEIDGIFFFFFVSVCSGFALVLAL